MKTFKLAIVTLGGLLFFVLNAYARSFTDSEGRRIDAELIDVREDNVILKRNGKTYAWPQAKLSLADQLYVKQWAATHTKSTARVQVRLWQRDGMGSTGTFEADNQRASAPKGPPVLSATEKKAKYKHYEVYLTNRGKEDATQLTMSYVIFLIDGSGKLIPQSDSRPVERLSPEERVTVETRGATLLSTKTVTTTLSIRNQSLRTGSDTSRSKDRFGGVWVRIYSGDQLVGEKRDLVREVEKLDPAWTGPVGKPTISIPEILSSLPLPKLPEGLPKPPVDLPKPPKPPFER